MTEFDDKTVDEILEMDRLEYIENQNPLRPEELKDPHRIIKIELLGIIAAYQEPVCCNKIFRDFYEMNGYDLNPEQYGFKSFTSMMRTFSDKFNSHNDGFKTTYTAKTTERSGHLQELIKNQVTIEEKRRRDLRRSRSYSRPRKSNYGAGIYYAQNFVPLIMDERSVEERTADNMANFGRSLAATMGSALDWGMGRRHRLESSSSSDEETGGVPLSKRSASVPPSRSPKANGEKLPNVHDDPKSGNLDDCTNPFRVQNNVRIRDIVITHGEADDTGRKGLALVEVASRFRKEHRLPLGGVPNMPEDRLLAKMQAVDTVEWTVERMGDGVAYVIVPADTVEKAHKVGPGTASAAPKDAPTEKPKTTGLSPAAKRMFGFALKEAVSNNNRQHGTRERVIAERNRKTSLSSVEYEYGADSDGDPVAIPVPKDRRQQPEPTPYDRADIMALSKNDDIGKDLSWKLAAMRILRSQVSSSPPRQVSRSSSSSSVGPRPTQQRPSARPTLPQSAASMWGSQPSSGGGFGNVPSFGTIKSTPPPAAAADKDIDASVIIQPSHSSLASKLPGMASLSAPKTSTIAPSSSSLSGVSFGTSSLAVPSTASAARSSTPSFGTQAPAFPSSFGANKAPAPQSEPAKNGSEKSELLGATIQLIGKLRGGMIVFMHQIERTPVEDVVANNPDFFDIDEKDERIHLLHKDVDPKLLMVDGQQLGDLVAEEEKKVEAPVPEAPKESRGTFTKPPSFGRSQLENKPTFGSAFAGSQREAPTFGSPRPPRIEDDGPASSSPARPVETKARELPTFGNGLIKKAEEKQPEPRVAPSFGTRPVDRAPPTFTAAPVSTPAPVQPLAGMPSFGTKSLEVVQRPDSAMSNRTEEPRKAPTFGAASLRPPADPVVEKPTRESSTSSDSDSDSVQDSSKYTTAASAISSRNGASMASLSGSSIHSSQDTLEAEEMKDDKEETGTGPFAFPNHPDIRKLSKKPTAALDSIRKGEIHLAAILTSLAPNRVILSLRDERTMDNLHTIMTTFRTAYVDQPPLTEVKLGQFAVAISDEAIVRVVVVRKLEPGENGEMYECACLDFYALICVNKGDLYKLLDQFDVHALRTTTFIARLNGISNMTDGGHKAVKIVVKRQCEEDDSNIKKAIPFIYHGKDEVSGDHVVDLAVVIGDNCLWMGEALPLFMPVSIEPNAHINPDIENALELAVKHGLLGYEKTLEMKKKAVVEEKKAEEKSDTTTIRSDQLNRVPDASFTKKEPAVEEKEEGELDSSHDDSTTSCTTTVERLGAGVADFVRDVKEEVVEDEFVVVAPVGPKPIVDVQSMTSLIGLLNSKGEHVEVTVIKSICRALILSANKALSDLGERGALIANAEALEEIDSL